MVVFERIFISFQGENVLSSFSASIKKGDKIAFSGVSGSGKTTLLNLIMGFVIPQQGTVLINGLKMNAQNVKTIRKLLAWLPQELSFEVINCRELLLFPFRFSANIIHLPTETDINTMLQKLLLDPSILEKQLDAISGGQKQRLMIASTLLQKKPIVLLDEPTSALDKVSAEAVLSLIKQSVDTTFISSSHDPLWNQGMDRIIHVQNKNYTNE